MKENSLGVIERSLASLHEEVFRGRRGGGGGGGRGVPVNPYGVSVYCAFANLMLWTALKIRVMWRGCSSAECF